MAGGNAFCHVSRMRLPLVVLCLLVLMLPACSHPKSTPAKNSEEGNLVHVNKEDAAMNAAIAKAKATIGDFVQAFHAAKPGTSEFFVKKPYRNPGDGAEHMWIRVDEEKDGVIKGVVANEAEETKEVKLGDAVVLNLSEISDWKYQDGKKLIGGYTVRYFFERMNPQERAAFLKETGLEL